MNTSNIIQIEVPDFDPDIDGRLPNQQAQGSASTTQKSFKKSDERKAPALLQRDVEEVDWPDVIPVEIPPQSDQDIEQDIPVLSTRCETNLLEIPQLESELEEEEGQPEDLQTYLSHHNTYQESQNICKEYRKRLLDINDDRYFQDIDRAYKPYGPTRDYIPLNQAPGPRHMTQELIQTFGRGRGQARRDELHSHDPLEHERDLYRAEYNAKSRKLNACVRGMQVRNNLFYTIIQYVHN